MVCETEKPSLRAASCWRVEVVNGGGRGALHGMLGYGRDAEACSSASLQKAWASSWVAKR